MPVVRTTPSTSSSNPPPLSLRTQATHWPRPSDSPSQAQNLPSVIKSNQDYLPVMRIAPSTSTSNPPLLSLRSHSPHSIRSSITLSQGQNLPPVTKGKPTACPTAICTTVFGVATKSSNLYFATSSLVFGASSSPPLERDIYLTSIPPLLSL